MRTESLKYALIAGIVTSVVVLLSSVRSNLQIDSVIAYGVCFGVVAVAVIEYRIRWKSLVGK